VVDGEYAGIAVVGNCFAFGFLKVFLKLEPAPSGPATSIPFPLSWPFPVIVRTLEKQFSQLSFTTWPLGGRLVNWGMGICDFPPLGTAVLDDSKFGMLGTEGNGELFPPGL